jgi:hypothetical protein
MTTTVTVTTDTVSCTLAGPSAAELPHYAKTIGGWWNPTDKVWTFDVRDEARVRALAVKLYGTDGSGADMPTITVRIPVPARFTPYRYQELVLAGRTLAFRPGRDTPVRYADDVVLVSGGFPPRGGSVKKPVLGEARADTLLEVRDVPLAVGLQMIEEAGGGELVDGAAERRAALTAERDRLLTRLAAIDAELATAPA